MSAYPPAGGYGQPAYGHHSTVIVTSQPHFVAPVMFRDFPVSMTCPHCNAHITTSVYYEVGTITWVVCLLLAFFGLWLFCCLIPFCLDSCKDAVHSCPNCRAMVGRHTRM